MDVETRELQQLLKDAGQLPEVLLLKPVTTSTNDDVRDLAHKGIRQVLVSSRAQTQGRGQRQRQWISPEGNIYLSTLLNTEIPIDGRLALEVALNILQMPGLQKLDLQVKWPNDLYSQNAKWGGILVEPISTHQAVVGVGINLAPIEAEQLDQPITSLSELGLATVIRNQLIAELYQAIQQAGQWFNHGSHNLAARFNHYAAFIQQQVEFTDLQGQYAGIFAGIQEDGAVQIETESGIQTFYQGQLRLKTGS
ncbi:MULTISPECIES: biotin--[acetyl-CoA-carboxylase] ligase [Acinetobacter]|uniref:biotin--[biotin carboxyl-carrier protein] ligase n=1 Tax=Acinetobacter schindleri NIPH 900 TaxID=1217675 RepID=N8XXM1_9GAMM|nr:MULTISPECIES: biotin--[acetyl-CoA-carboxylase] ligase [Acinetobacter]ENV11815.1 biotin-[acetyl-CoA-carboxylase] ligase [Acinetobacter schindleri NIPH 900]POU24452.1 biotin--[acetyl-CoA-carboxylase] ligase [Acinetobacter sp. ACNIH3]POV78695.1 biotin--[acetyl-CoA-carboxylase] ligase [Acinetobacter sp. ACNIH4]RAZ05279.1 biotin--[acetyl-CoA-carboxylase] ligase [Acinetobacter sp. SM1B]